MPQPIDPHTELGRATAVERIQQIADRASLAAQARVTIDAANKQAQTATQVRQAMNKNEEVDRELQRRTPYARRRQKDRDGRDDGASRHFYDASEKDVIADDPADHRLDVEI